MTVTHLFAYILFRLSILIAKIFYLNHDFLHQNYFNKIKCDTYESLTLCELNMALVGGAVLSKGEFIHQFSISRNIQITRQRSERESCYKSYVRNDPARKWTLHSFILFETYTIYQVVEYMPYNVTFFYEIFSSFR